MGDKAARKKGVSKVFKDLKIVEFENPEEDEELVKYYQNKNFVAPLPRKFETVRRFPTRVQRGGRTESGERIGQKVHRGL